MDEYKIYSLRCLNCKNPRGIGETPCFSWKLAGEKNNTFQKKYRICVWEEESLIWDTGEVESENTSGILYRGPALKTGTGYQWQVVSCDNYNHEAVSEKAFFMTGIMESDFWKASWIESGISKKPLTETTDSGAIFAGLVTSDEYPEEKLDAPVYFRKEFTVAKPVKKVMLYATALGNYVFSIDGKRVSNLLAPEYTAYGKHVEYQTYDVTNLCSQPGIHAAGIILSDGWYSGKIGLMGIGHQYGRDNALLFQIEIEYADKSRECVCSDKQVKWYIGGYLYADLFVGEYLDYGRIPKDFDRAGFDDSVWKSVRKKDYGYESISAQSVEPVEIVRKIKPKLIRTPKEEMVLDAGENICGYTRFAMETPVGVEIGLEHSEVLDRDGNFLQNIMGQNKNQKDRVKTGDTYTIYEPKFTFHGFRYVKVTGLSEVREEDFTVCVLSSRMDRTGSFRCSDERLSKLQENIFRSQQGNMLCVPTDCPQRERAGWTGDMEVYAPTAAFNMDIQSFMERWLADMRLEQHKDGQIPHVIPDIASNQYVNGGGESSHISSAGWADACVLVPYALYRAYGNEEILKKNYGMMKKWMNYVESKTGKNLCEWGKLFHFGDWLIPSIVAETHNPMLTALRTKEEVALAYLAHTANCMAEIAAVLGQAEDAEHYLQLTQRAREVFSETYVSSDGKMREQLQGLYVVALAEHMLSLKQRKGAARRLCSLIHEAGDCLDTGFLSVPFLLDVLCENNASETAFRILFQEEKPGWLYALRWGATTIWENWAAVLPDGVRTNSSYNHFAFGCVGDFIYRRIGGLQIEEPGYKKVRIDPDYSCGLEWAETTYDSVHGKIAIYWEKKEEGITLRAVLPPNVSGIVHVGEKQIEVGNGRYEFIIPCGRIENKPDIDN